MSEKDERMLKKITPYLIAWKNDFLSETTLPFAVAETAEAAIRNGFDQRIKKIIEPAVFNLFLKELTEEDMLDEYLDHPESGLLDPYRKAFTDEIISTHGNVLYASFPALKEKVNLCIQLYTGMITEMFSRLADHYEEVVSKLLDDQPFLEIISLRIDCGDVHNYGRSTLIIETDAGKIVYKPHDVHSDEAGRKLIDTFFSDILKAPSVCAYEGYGFVEYIENRPADTEEKAAVYMEHLGGLCAMLQMLGSADMHHSNVLSDGLRPVIIDYELIFTPGKNYRKNTLIYDLDHSLYYTSLMPHRWGQIEMSILFAKDEENISTPLISGKRKNIIHYQEEFLAGFQRIYHRCMEKREEIREMIRSLTDIPVRHLYRNTGTYQNLIDKSFEPGWLSADDFEQEVKKGLSLAMKRSGAKASELLTDAETDAILRGDIPYFYTMTDSCDLYAEGHIVTEKFFVRNCLDHILERLEYLNEDDLAFEISILKKAMHRVLIPCEQKTDDIKPDPNRTLDNKDLLSSAENLFLQVYDDAIVTPGGNMCWFGPDYYLQTGMNVKTLGLMDGLSGIAVFAAAVYRFTEKAEIRETAKIITDHVFHRLQENADELDRFAVIYPNIEDISFSYGLAGKLLACHMMGYYLQDEKYQILAQKYLSAVQKTDLTYVRTDIYQGMAGLLKVLCKVDDYFQKDGIPEFCDKLADRLIASADIPYQDGMLWRTLSAKWAVSGAGHGQSGMASALSVAAKRLDRSDLLSYAARAIVFENEIYSPSLKAWPDLRMQKKADTYMTGYCSGAPGIGLNALEMRYAGYRKVLDRALDSTLREPVRYKDFLCCGNCASIEFLLQAEMIPEARSLMAAIIERAKRNGFYHCTSDRLNDVFSPGLFYGVSGIGYEMLRLYSPEETMSILL